MKIGFLTTTFDETNGWGRYATGFLTEARRHHGSENVLVPDPRRLRSGVMCWKQPVLALFDAFRLRAELWGCDVIHAAVEPAAPLAYFLSLLLHKPFVVSLHGTYADLRSYAKTVRWLYRLSFSWATRLVAVSRYTAAVTRRAFPAGPIAIVPGGCTPPTNAVQRERASPRRNILAVGALKPRKGFHTLIEALGLLKKKGFSFRADIVGPEGAGSLFNPVSRSAYVTRLQTLVMERGLSGQLTLHGKVSEETLDRHYAAADLFALPSEHDGLAFEGLGLVYVEALARGLPVIGCLESGAEDVIQDGVNGRLVPPGDAGALAGAIKEILGNEATWKRMSAAAPASIERFRWEQVGAEMDKVYKEAMVEYAR